MVTAFLVKVCLVYVSIKGIAISFHFVYHSHNTTIEDRYYRDGVAKDLIVEERTLLPN